MLASFSTLAWVEAFLQIHQDATFALRPLNHVVTNKRLPSSQHHPPFPCTPKFSPLVSMITLVALSGHIAFSNLAVLFDPLVRTLRGPSSPGRTEYHTIQTGPDCGDIARSPCAYQRVRSSLLDAGSRIILLGFSFNKSSSDSAILQLLWALTGGLQPSQDVENFVAGVDMDLAELAAIQQSSLDKGCCSTESCVQLQEIVASCERCGRMPQFQLHASCP